VSGWIILALGLAIGAVDFIIGLRFSRVGEEQLERLPGDSAPSPEGARRLGRLIMLAAPLGFLVFAALAFGLIPVDGIDPISFN
jgi:hypothetical protein